MVLEVIVIREVVGGLLGRWFGTARGVILLLALGTAQRWKGEGRVEPPSVVSRMEQSEVAAAWDQRSLVVRSPV